VEIFAVQFRNERRLGPDARFAAMSLV